MKYIDAQFAMIQARITYWNALIVSGGYKTVTKTQRGRGANPDGTIIWGPMTDEEKLEHCLGVLQNHLDRLQEFTDAIGKIYYRDEE